MMNTLITNASNTLNHIVEAYYRTSDVPAQKITNIQTSISALDALGKMGIVGGVVGLGMSWTVNCLPWVGGMLALTTSIASIAAGILGFDATQAAKSLRARYLIQTLNSTERFSISALEDFKISVIDTATQHTLIASMFVSMYHGSRPTARSTT